MVLHSKGAKIGMSIMLFFQLCGWVVSLGGTAHATNECRDETSDWNANGGVAATHLQPFPAPTADESRAYDCGIHFSLDWWIVMFQFALIIFGFLAVFLESCHTKYIVMNMFAISTALFTIYTSVYVKLGYQFGGGSHDSNSVAQGFKTASAGGIIVCVCNYIFLFIFGSKEGESEEPMESKA